MLLLCLRCHCSFNGSYAGQQCPSCNSSDTVEN
jgi:RNA polymerase subunit RPABC4/transcription elongation factor Spt4